MNRKEQFEKIASEAADLFDIKNTAYDDDYFRHDAKGRWYGGAARKIARLQSFYERDIHDGEDVKETWKDLAIYSIMELIKLGEVENNEKESNC